MASSLYISIIFLGFLAAINGNTLHTLTHAPLDCSRFKRDLDVLRTFPFTVQLNPLITSGKTYAMMNTASQLEELSIFHETVLPLDVFCLVNLHTLRVNGTQFAVHYEIDGLTKSTGLSPLISRLTRLRVLSLVNTTASYIPPQSLAVLTNLTSLQVDNCGLREIPSTLSTLVNLQELRLSKNHLYYMPDENALRALSKLKHFDLSFNKIRDITDLYMMTSRLVNTMDFGNNEIDYVPPEISQFFYELYYLYLNDNKLNYIPTDIFRLQYLKKADLQRNLFPVDELNAIKSRFRVSIPNCQVTV